MIKPTVGRVVWYTPGMGHPWREDAPLAAIVAKVHNDTLVNLMVIDSAGNPHGRPGVELCHGETRPSGAEYCEWMPYQKGQAAKTEELEKKAANI